MKIETQNLVKKCHNKAVVDLPDLVTGLWIVLLLFQWGIVAYFAGVNG